MQLSVAWGARPADEPLNIEDVVTLPDSIALNYPQVVPLRSDAGRYEQRRADLRHALGDYWRRSSEAMELFPWEVSWFVREIGRCNPQHALTAAFLRGQQCHTPSWDSTRKAIFMKTDNLECDPWLLEDIGLRCGLAADRMEGALKIGRGIVAQLSGDLREMFVRGLEELDEFRRRALSCTLHLSETNLVGILREAHQRKQPLPENVLKELADVLRRDQANMQSELTIGPALEMLEQVPLRFIEEYFQVPPKNGEPCGSFTLTSR